LLGLERLQIFVILGDVMDFGPDAQSFVVIQIDVGIDRSPR
jgi:hypothetical protein